MLGRLRKIAWREIRSKPTFQKRLEQLVRDGCVAVVLEIVRQDDGRVLTQREWNTICDCCQRVGIYLVVDECLTALRCGAPFAHQLPQYSEFKPSFVIFGKALFSSGIAVNYDGVHVSRLGYTDSKGLLEGWDHNPSRVLEPLAAIQSMGVIRLAEREQWWDRSTRIGENLRSVIKGIYPSLQLGGLGALIYLPKAIAESVEVIGASTGACCRWMPYLDEGMDDAEQVYALFGEHARSFREHLCSRLKSLTFRTLFCILCAECAVDDLIQCRNCYGYICRSCRDLASARRHMAGQCATGEATCSRKRRRLELGKLKTRSRAPLSRAVKRGSQQD